MEFKKLKELMSKDGGKQTRLNLFTAVAFGVILLIIGNTFFSSPDKEEKTEAAFKSVEETDAWNEKTLEDRLSDILQYVKGAGEVKVMIIQAESAETVFASDESKDTESVNEAGSSGDRRITSKESMETSTVIIDGSGENGQPLVSKEISPRIEGVLIVSEGGDNPTVKSDISKAVESLLNVPAHKIQVLKMK
ncbi:MAG: stage III sporulation protein AG [Lachnospiraceae bacterium]|nr:stage III sporulation protein AG [Lachnospiraceae bacterium]